MQSDSPKCTFLRRRFLDTATKVAHLTHLKRTGVASEELRRLWASLVILLVFSYQKIIGMGPAVVPLILSELEKEPDHWFWALEAITDENPVSESDAGDIEASARVGVQWGRDKGLPTE